MPLSDLRVDRLRRWYTLEVPGLPPRRVHAQPVADSGFVEFSVVLPDSTPPGTYTGHVRGAEDDVMDIELEVEEIEALEIFPRSIRAKLVPRKKESRPLRLFNVGNVPLEIPTRYTFGIYDVDSLGVGLAQTFLRTHGAPGTAVTQPRPERSGQSPKVRRGAAPKPKRGQADQLVEEVIGKRATLLAISLDAGGDKAIILAPSEAREVVMQLAVLAWPEEPGRVYIGHWPLLNRRPGVRIELSSSKEEVA